MPVLGAIFGIFISYIIREIYKLLKKEKETRREELQYYLRSTKGILKYFLEHCFCHSTNNT